MCMKIKLTQNFAEEIEPAVEPATITEGIEDIIGSKTGFAEVMKSAPLIRQEDIATEQVVLPEENVELATKKSDVEPEVLPSAGDKTEEEETEDRPAVIQIGGFELTEEEWLQARKDSQNKSSWESKLKKINQIEKFVDGDDDKLLNLALYATGRKELPADFLSGVDLPETIELPDEDGVMVEFKTANLPPNLIEALKNKALAEMLPNTVKLAEENKNLKARVEEFDRDAQETGVIYVENFVNDNEELRIPLEKGQSFKDSLVEILQLPEHPAYQKAFRIKTIMEVSQSNNISMSEANKMLFGKANAIKKVNDNILHNQTSTASHVKPSPETPVVDTLDSFIQNMGDKKARAVNALFK